MSTSPSRVTSSIKPSKSTLEGAIDGAHESGAFDIISAYGRQLQNEDTPMPIAAVLALTELIANSRAETMYELVEALKLGAATLKRGTPNPISLTAGCDLFIRYVTTARQESPSFSDHKNHLVREGNLYAHNLASTCREQITKLSAGFIPDEAVILTHSYSRVVIQTLIHAHKRKRISVFVTEARPLGLGVKAHEILVQAGIPCTLVLDSAVAYIMDKIDLVLVGSEAVVESGGLINAVGSYQMAIIAKAANKPLYALAESYKFLRSFPLSQYDLPSHSPNVLRVPTQHASKSSTSASRNSTSSIKSARSSNRCHPMGSRTMGNKSSASYIPLTMTVDQLANNPEVDYTRPDLITLVFSDVGILTPSGVSQFLVGIFAD
ncbi:hypothetical protein BS47DRAFT_1370529 [Hydnum rufescens UP504]|uniref:Translation initiation factor eIF2B subunit alpha n=1 Tax=Hydnum rufescens UP504 TaxID=1448309 RepID=A0A9P6BBY0_9AGAM|nr:hypothetical protein BS47DRAFT_1370529 [Hydnum rufescens UP504]